MRTVEEVKTIFVEEACKALDTHFEELAKCTDSMLNKVEDGQKQYEILCETLSKCLPARGVTSEELNMFIPHLAECQSDIAAYAMRKLKKESKSGEDTGN